MTVMNKFHNTELMQFRFETLKINYLELLSVNFNFKFLEWLDLKTLQKLKCKK